MFTGLVEEVGKVVALTGDKGTKRLTVAASKLPREMKKGDSIAVSGVCLTAVEIRKNSLGFDLAVETLARTSLSRLAKGALVNWAALVAGVVDKVFLYYAPKILAGTGSVPFAGGKGFRRMSDAAQVKIITLHRFGEDFAVEGYIRDPYEIG